MSGTMMLNHLGETEAANRIRTAYDSVLADGNPEHITPDIGGKGTTQSFTDAVIRAMK
jgi:isocitrate/isopropylmalate dehydrogenase